MKTITDNIVKSLCSVLSKRDDFVFLDTSRPDSANTRSLLFLHPVKRLQFFHGEDENRFLKEVEQLQRQGFYISGWFSYEFGYLLEPTLKRRLTRKDDEKVLLADLGVFSSCHTFDHETGEHDFPLEGCAEEFPRYRVDNLRASLTEEEYIGALHKILAYIEAGDTYQVNYTLKLFFDFDGSPERFYCDLRRNQSVGYGSCMRWHDRRIMSFSPELFFWKKGGEVRVRPMKGTLKRGKTLAEDAENRKFLTSDVKNQSENVMIVDLLRNDLGHLMHYLPGGDVRVDSLFDVETYETLLQMTSTITASSKRSALDGLPLRSFLQAIFPCGSVTGAPKIRTMEIIDELEKERRGVYTGAIGCFFPDGEAVFNVPIRTVVLDGNRGEMGIGSGIVHDSDPQQEWQECLLKGRFLTAPQQEFELLETMLWHPERGLWLVEEHLDRLEASAEYFFFQFDRNTIQTALERLAGLKEDSPSKIRLLLHKDGTFHLEQAPCSAPERWELPEKPEPPADFLPQVALSRNTIDSDLRWFYHKTTNRQFYNEEYAAASKAGLMDMLFQNERGEITEGCISNIVIYKDGRYLTPPVGDGLLPGVMRQHLLRSSGNTGTLLERSLYVRDLESAEAIFLCNSVRGVVRVTLKSI